MKEIIQHIKDHDYTNPIDLIEPHFLKALIYEAKKKPTSIKCLHKNSKFIQLIAFNPKILSVVKEIIGNKFYLWGSSLITSVPNHVHRYHVDAEHFHIKGVTVSIALENCTEDNKFYFISNSDSISTSPQELQPDKQITQELEKFVKHYNQNAKHVEITMKNGQCMFWKGRTWHSTENKSNKTRLSLILQYAVSNPRIPTSYDDPKAPVSNTNFDSIYIS